MAKGKNKKIIGLIKDELGGKNLIKFFGLGAKTHSYLIDDGSGNKRAKGTKKCPIVRKPKFENYKNCFKATQKFENYKNCVKATKVEDTIKHLKKIRLT